MNCNKIIVAPNAFTHVVPETLGPTSVRRDSDVLKSSA